MTCANDRDLMKQLRIAELYIERLTPDDQDLMRSWIQQILSTPPDQEEYRQQLISFSLEKLRCGCMPTSFRVLCPNGPLPSMEQVLEIENEYPSSCTTDTGSCYPESGSAKSYSDALEDYSANDTPNQCSSAPEAAPSCPEEAGQDEVATCDPEEESEGEVFCSEDVVEEEESEFKDREREIEEELSDLSQYGDDMPSCAESEPEDQKIEMPGLKPNEDEYDEEELFDMLDFLDKYKTAVRGNETMLIQIMDAEVRRATCIMKSFTDTKLSLYKEAVNAIVQDTQAKYSDLLEAYKQQAEQAVARIEAVFPFFDRDFWQNYTEDPRTVYEPFLKQEEDLYVLDNYEKDQIEEFRATKQRLTKEYEQLKEEELMKETRNAEGKRRLKLSQAEGQSKSSSDKLRKEARKRQFAVCTTEEDLKSRMNCACP